MATEGRKVKLPTSPDITITLVKAFGTSDYISIDKQFNPLLIKTYKNITAFNPSKCNNIGVCPILLRSLFSLTPNLSIIGNVSKSTSILILNGENDSQTPVQQAFLLQQRLTEVNHPDHTLITYPNLGHAFYPSSEWLTSIGPIQPYVLADLYASLEAHSGISYSYIITATTQEQRNSSRPIFFPFHLNDRWPQRNRSSQISQLQQCFFSIFVYILVVIIVLVLVGRIRYQQTVLY